MPTRSLHFALLATCVGGIAAGDEGMWRPRGLPMATLSERYDFEPGPEWINQMAGACARLSCGGSAAFVSAKGLVLTNHHIAAPTLQGMSTAQRDYYRDGFVAAEHGDEIPAPGLVLSVLHSTADVSDEVLAAVQPGMTDAEAFAARSAAIAAIEAESLEVTGLASDVVPLDRGARYELYRYRTYSDVRLAFAPELAVAFFGGDADNFEFPRYALDVCLFRVYEDGRPLETASYLRRCREGPYEGELVFAVGHPGRTHRFTTVAALEFLRDVRLPYTLELLRRREILLMQFAAEGPEQARQVQEELYQIRNSRKAYVGRLEGLQDPFLLARRRASEEQLRGAVEADPEMRELAGGAWDRIATAQAAYGRCIERRALIELGAGFDSQLFELARHLVRMAAEESRSEDQRLPEYCAAAREEIERYVLSDIWLDAELEARRLADSLAFLAESLGADDPFVRKVLDGKGPRARAAALVTGTRLADLDERRQFVKGGMRAIEGSDDPMILLARLVDPEALAVRRQYEEEVAEPENQAYAQISQVSLRLVGRDAPPDTNSTLRFSFGTVSGYDDGSGAVPPWTTLGGAFEHAERHGGREPWSLPTSWLAARDDLDGSLPLNFACSCDVTAGSSGSPVVNRRGELVGMVFDVNVDALVGDYVYDDARQRAVAVHAGALSEVLRHVYHSDHLADEFGR